MRKSLSVTCAVGLLSAAVAAQSIGPSTATPCYILPSPTLPPSSVQTVSLLTVGDSIGGYRMVGIPDGMGVFGDSSAATILLSHELTASAGIVRAHGSAGAFVSRWGFDPATKAFTAGRDHSTAASDVNTFNRTTQAWVAGTTAWDRFCSSDLAAPSAFEFNGIGTSARLFLAGEESNTARAFAHVVSGPDINKSYELPHLGQCAFENVVASPFGQAKTIVVGLDDSSASTAPVGTPSEVYVYIGMKQGVGNDIERAGLVGGTLYGLRVSVGGNVVGGENNTNALGTSSYVNNGTFELVSLGDASTYNGAAQQTLAITNNVTRFQRVEDGAFDTRPGHENDFYFVTTASFSTNSRLWRVRFTDITQPELGGTITALLAGNEGHKMLDNLTIDPLGRIFCQEDPGNQAHLAKIWMYDTTNDRFLQVVTANPALFTTGLPGFLTADEETSGVIPAFDVLGEGWYFLNTQAHYGIPADPELVQGGQMLAMYVNPELGRRLALWYTSPLGVGSVAMNHAFGTPGGQVFTAVSFLAGAYPNDWFFGIETSFSEVLFQASLGAPFLAALDGNGNLTSATYLTGLSGTTLYSVAIDNIAAPLSSISRPVAYQIP